MLHQLSADQQSFKTIKFLTGLNIIMADRKRDQSEEHDVLTRRTRNGAGKSSVIDLIHFLLAGKAEGALTSKALADWSFDMSLDVGSRRVRVCRSPADSHISIQDVTGAAEGELSATETTNAAWGSRLGQVWFDLSSGRAAGAASFRQLISYFSRRRRDGGYDDPVRTFRAQANAVGETNLALLFGLDSEIVRRFHLAKNAQKQTQAALKALRDSQKSVPVGSRRVDLEAELSAKMAAAKFARDHLKSRVDSFNVLPVFRDLERELAMLNERGRDLSDDDVLDQEAIDANTRALDIEEQALNPQIDKLFAEAAIVFPEIVGRRYDEVARFHKRLTENRQVHLQNEIASARHRISERQSLREDVEFRRRQITSALRSGGPADELFRLRDELADKDGVVRVLEAKLTEARSLEKQAEDRQREVEEATRALRQDRRDRSAIVDQASRTFSAISERLYDSPGQLAISASEQGLRFVPTMPSSQSAGVMSMQIFCFDLTMATLCQARGMGPKFLIHDSHLFEPVDGRQFARALRIGSEVATELGIQYIVTLNSDELVRAETEGSENFRQFVLEPVLSDDPEGGLFGVRFD